MATLAALHPASQTTNRPPPSSDRLFALSLVSALTLLALGIGGYHPYAEDGGLYIAGVKRLLDPALYPRGTAFVLEPTRFSLFAPMVAALTRLTHLELPAVLLALSLASIWATLFAAWTLAARCWTTRPARAGAVALLACWLGLPIAGTALLFMDPYLTARSLSTPCMILALAGALDMTVRSNSNAAQRRGLLLWLGSIAFGTAMHPLMAAYAFAASLVLLCVRSSRRGGTRIWGVATLCAAALILAATLQALAPAETPEYIRIALTRSYWFLAQWRWYEVAGLAAPLAIVASFAWIRSDASTQEERSRHALMRMAVTVGATAAIVALLFARAEAPTHLVARLQPMRIFQAVYLVMILILGATLGERLLQRSLVRWTAAFALIAGIMLTASSAAYPNSSHMELPSTASANQWVRAFAWIREHTPKDALFALDADYINAPGEDAQCFRAIAERSALADYSKDGGEASIAPALTPEWTAEQQAQKGLSSATDTQRLATLGPLGVSWLVLDAAAATSFDCPYRNASVQVCRLP